jgi:uncharacterized protein
MKKRLSLVLFFIAHVVFVFSQTSSSSLLWKISGKKLKQPSYLYGTMHVQDESVFMLEDHLKKYIDKSDAFAMEILLDEVDPMQVQKHILLKNTTLKDLLTEEEYNQLDEFLKRELGQGLLLFNRMKPFFLASQIMQLSMSQDKELAMDLYLLKYARSQNKRIFEVERFEEQIKAIDKISLPEQIKMLMQLIHEEEKNDDKKDKMFQAYISQDIELLYEQTTSDTTMPSNFVDVFITERNKRMTKRTIKMIKKQSVFIAVGAAHLGGPNGMIPLLRKRGYTVEPIVVNPQ